MGTFIMPMDYIIERLSECEMDSRSNVHCFIQWKK
jgi:hypothetical protein